MRVCASLCVYVYEWTHVCVRGFCLWIVCFCSFSNTAIATASSWLRSFIALSPSSVYFDLSNAVIHSHIQTREQLQPQRKMKISSSSWSTMSGKCMCMCAFLPNKPRVQFYCDFVWNSIGQNSGNSFDDVSHLELIYGRILLDLNPTFSVWNSLIESINIYNWCEHKTMNFLIREPD